MTSQSGFSVGTAEKSLPELVLDLPPEVHAEVRDFVEFLLTKYGQRLRRKLQQNWAGALRDYRQQYTGVELQHQVSGWRGEYTGGGFGG